MDSNNKENSSKKNIKILNIFRPVKEPDRKKQVLVSMVVFIVLFCLLIGYLVINYYVNRKNYINNSYSKEETNLMKQNLRGAIFSSDGELLAYSEPQADGTQKRIYPYGSVFCHAIGFSSLGKSGVEYDLNYYLLKSFDDPITKAISKSNIGFARGNTVVTTLDSSLQKTADELLGNRDGAVIMTEVKTGRVLALVSHPNYNPNNIEELWEGLIGNEDESALVNRATQGLYPPGSTFKIFTAYEYRREGFDVNDYEYECQGFYINDGYKISCYHGGSHGDVDFKQSFAKSCNSSFANIGMSLNRKSFSNGLDRLLFFTELPDLFGNAKTSVSTYDLSTDYKQMQASIGQGETNVSPYHINLITMAIANKGTIMTPHITDSVRSSKGAVIKNYHSSEYKNIMSEESADYLKDLMRAVVTDGTASALQSDSYEAAGKTGSAEYNNNGDSHGWFTGFAPLEDPEVAVTIIVEKGGTGSSSAVPLAKALFDDYFSNK